ncbi:MAG: EF-P lysine aminoacylase EpmA [Halothiobacillaceae bacterium]
MTETTDWRPGCDPAVLHLRARMLRALRAFMDERAVLEVETPLLTPGANHDAHIENLAVNAHDTQGAPLSLQASPELYMKRLLAAGSGPIWQLCKVFRAGETGTRHNPEFTMLEWYLPGYDLDGMVGATLELFQQLRRTAGLPPLPIRRLTYRDAFWQTTGLDPFVASPTELAACAEASGLRLHESADLDRSDWLDLLLSEVVQACFSQDHFTVLCAFPADQAALARTRQDGQGNQVAERCEIFQGRLELANGYQELTDAGEQRRRFADEARRRNARGEAPTRMDARFMAALESGLPDCAGLSVGFDRLLMTCAGVDRIQAVLAFDYGRL